MKKSLWKMISMVFLIVALLPVNAFAENGNEVRLDETGRVTIVSPSASAEGVSSLQFSLTVDAENAARVEFAFDADHAKISEFRYHQETKRLNVYMAGTEALFNQDNNALTMGRVVVLDGNGNDVAATVTVAADSVQYVSGSELKAMEEVSVSDPVRLPGKEPGNDGDDGSGDDGNNGDNGSGDNGNGGSEGDNSGNDDSDDDDDDDESQDNGSQGTNGQGGNQGAGSSRPVDGSQSSKPQGGTQGSKPADSTQGTSGSTQPVTSPEPAASSSAQSTPAPTEAPSAAPEVTPSAESNSSQSSQAPSATPETQPVVGNGQDGTEAGQGMNWILILVIIAVVLLAGVGIMAGVVLNGKPKKRDSGDEQ